MRLYPALSMVLYPASSKQLYPASSNLDMLLAHPQVIIGAMLILLGGLALIVLDHIDFSKPKRKKDEDTEETKDEGRQAD